MNNNILQVSPRMPDSKAKQLRRQGYIPGVIYGKSHATAPVLFDKRNVENLVHRMGIGAVFEVYLNGIKQTVKIREIQRDPVTREIIHLDLLNVEMDQVIQAKVPLRFEGRRAVEKYGLILQHQKDSIEVEGLAKDIPSFIRVPLHMLQNNRSSNIRVQDLEVADELSIIDPPGDLIASALRPALKIETLDEPNQEEEKDMKEPTENIEE